MKTIEIYSFEELSESAQETAVEDLRTEVGKILSEWDSDEYAAAIPDIEQAFGIKIKSYNYYYYNPDFEFTINDEARTGDLLRWFNNLPELPNKRKWYGKYSDSQKKHLCRRSRILLTNDACMLTGSWVDVAIDEAVNNIYEFARKGYTVYEFLDEMLHNFFQSWHNQIEDDYSEDVVRDYLINNDYDFLADGKQFI